MLLESGRQKRVLFDEKSDLGPEIIGIDRTKLKESREHEIIVVYDEEKNLTTAGDHRIVEFVFLGFKVAGSE